MMTTAAATTETATATASAASTRPHIVLCTEADSTVGLGHAVRCAGLLRSLALAHDLSVVGGGPVLQRFFPGARHLGAADWKQVDWQRLEGESGLAGVDLVLADIPYHRPRDWQRLRHSGAPLVAIDDHGGAVPADVVVNGTVLPDYHHYEAEPHRPGRRLCLGPEYALVRPEFAATPWHGVTGDPTSGDPTSGNPTSGDPTSGGATPGAPITVVAGSGAEARDWLLALARDLPELLIHHASLHDLSPAPSLRMIVGPAFDALPALRRLAEGNGIELQVGLAAADLAARLADSSVVLITAGMVLYEAVTAGVPTIAFPQIADLVPEAAWFAERGACIDLGPAGGSAVAAAAAIGRLLGDREAACRMSARQRRLLDGRGMARVTDILATYLRPEHR